MLKFFKSNQFILSVLLIIALGLRLDFLFPVSFVIDADEAIVGLMAKHFQEGRPLTTFYYGQHYMGSLEPILVSVVFKLFGASNIALKSIPLIFSLVLVVLVYKLTLGFAGRYAALLAALFIAVSPNPLVIWSAKARGGFIEILVIGATALLLAFNWLKKESPGRSLTFFICLALGLGWWVNNQIVYFMFPVGLMFFSKLFLYREGSLKNRFQGLMPHFLIGFSGFIIGGLPYWVYNVTHKFISFEIFGSSESKNLGKHFSGLFSTSIPIILGSKKFWGFDNLFSYSTALYYSAYVILLVIILINRKNNILNAFRLKFTDDSQVELLILFTIGACLAFALSSFGDLVHAPRYLLPIYISIACLTAYSIELISKKSRIIGIFVAIFIVSLNLLSNYSYGRNIPGEPFVYKQERVSRDHTELIKWLDENNINWVRTNYWIGYKLAFETNEKIKFDLFQEPVQLRIPEYREEALRKNIEEMPFILVPSQAILIQKAMRELGYKFDTAFIDGYKIIYNIKMPRYDYIPVDHNLLSAETNFRGDIANLAIDGDDNTRWGTAHPQNADMKFEIKISKPVHLLGLKYDLGNWAHDWPRGLKIEVQNVRGEVKEIFSDFEYTSIRYFTQDNAFFPIFFDANDIVKINLYQVSTDPVFDWSIAELTLLQADGKS